MSTDTQEQNEVDVDAALLLIEADPMANSSERRVAAEVRRLRKLFDDAGQGEHNVLALVDHYQAGVFEAEAEVEAARSLMDQLSASNLRLVAEREQLKSELAECEAVYKERLVELVSLTTGANVLTRKLTAISVLVEMQHDESLIAVGDVRRALFDTK